MKTLLFLLLTVSLHAQTGIYGWTSIQGASKQNLLTKYKNNGYKGVRIIVPWYSIQPIESDLSFTLLKSVIRLVSDNDLNMELHIWAGPDAPIFGQYNWLSEKGVRSFTTTGGHENGPWPDYYDPVYIAAYKTLHSALADMLHDLPADQKQHLKSVFVSSAHTADLQGYKGVPVGDSYGIEPDDETWHAYYRNQWATVYEYYQQNSDFMKVTMNGGNAPENLQWIIDNNFDVYVKQGDRSHEYPLLGEAYIINWPDRLWFGEVDADLQDSRIPADHFTVVRSALSVFTDRLDFFDTWVDHPWVPIITKFFNTYCNQFNPVTANRGFCALASKINFKDSTTYSKVQYGRLYFDEQQYNNQVRKINDMNIDSFQKQVRIVNTSRSNMNPDRMINLMRTGAGFAPEGPYYFNDISWYTFENYSLNVRQVLPNLTSIGDRSPDIDINQPEQNIMGRNGRKPITFQGKKALYFRVDDRLITTASSDNVLITVTYRDKGTTRWKITAGTAVKNITNTGTGQWKRVEFLVNGFRRGGQMANNSDFIIEIVNGDAFQFDMVEVYNTSK